MSLCVGTRLGTYEILAPLGAGGMGEVYLARDTKLKREVAIKVLPQAFAQDPDRLARFQREAELLAKLNHPNIAHIYGFEESDDVRAFVLELVEGPTLGDRIAQGPLPLDLALSIAKQIAEALEAAHEQGIVHRDLKPANIKLRPDGTVKVLDFGLAKALEPVSSISAQGTVAPTIIVPAMTQVGLVLGTAAYMSPEQARGKLVDKRTDIWAFGCVLYEMLTGRFAFAGETNSDTIARLLEREPEWRAIPTSVPPGIRELLHRCLQKDQQRRLHDIADARIVIEEGQTARPRRVVGVLVAVTGVAMALTLSAGAWWYASRSIPSGPRAPVSVLIADFDNRTGDPTFDRTLEPLLRIVLEGARFINAYDRAQISRSLDIQPPEKLDERAALELAVKQGLGVVLSGSLDREGGGYGVSVTATQAVTGTVIASAKDRAFNKDQVLGVVTKQATTVRKALGDDTSDSAQRFAMETLSATSLEAVHDYAIAQVAASNSRFEEARLGFSKAVQRDPKFGLAWAALAMASWNLDKQQDAEKYAKEALRHLDGMTERERYRARGNFYTVTSDYPQCVKEYTDLIAGYAEDAAARNNLALCLTRLRDMPKALDEIRHAVSILPKRALYRENLALYADYASDFQTAEREARAIPEPGVFGLLALALAQLGQGQLLQATETYEALAKIDGQGASYATSGLGDLALYEGRLSDAARVFAGGADADLKSKDTDRAANKLAALAFTQLLRQQKGAAIAAAEKALVNSNAVKIRFLAARVFVEAGATAEARTLAVRLASELDAEPQAYAKIIDGEAALKNGDTRQAIKALTEGNSLLDTWMGHFALGRAFLDAGQFTQADSEFDRCIKRRGEAMSLFLDEEPTYGFFPPVYYYQGRVREKLRSDNFGDSYRTYLTIRGKSTEDRLAQEIRRRVDH